MPASVHCRAITRFTSRICRNGSKENNVAAQKNTPSGLRRTESTNPMRFSRTNHAESSWANMFAAQMPLTPGIASREIGTKRRAMWIALTPSKSRRVNFILCSTEDD